MFSVLQTAETQKDSNPSALSLSDVKPPAQLAQIRPESGNLLLGAITESDTIIMFLMIKPNLDENILQLFLKDYLQTLKL